MGRTSERLGAVALVVIAIVAFIAIAFGVGYLVGKVLL
jgi:hypothetical protein